jgi:hypothetical protein
MLAQNVLTAYGLVGAYGLIFGHLMANFCKSKLGRWLSLL